MTKSDREAAARLLAVARKYRVRLSEAAQILASEEGRSDCVVCDESGRPLDPQPTPPFDLFDDPLPPPAG